VQRESGAPLIRDLSSLGVLYDPGSAAHHFRAALRPGNALHSTRNRAYITTMQWTDDGVVLGVKRHGETSVILELMTQERGRHLGLVRGGAGTRLRGVLQPGNSLRATWRARLDDHLGNYAVEGINLRAAGFLSAAHAVHGVTHLAALCRLLAEREPHASIHQALEMILDALDDRAAVAPLVAQFELVFLAELGFGLDLSCCAATGAKDDLIYVSPRSGRAVSRAAGEAYRDKLMRLPEFLRTESGSASAADIADAFALTGFFLDRHAFAPRGLALPDARARFVSAVLVRPT
jgi:DNA repair protein RecO (recombination protein O)